MKDFLLKIVGFIVSDPSLVEITEKEEEGLKIYSIIAPDEEIGKIIGRGGKVINAIRCLCRLKAIKNQERVLIKVGDQNENGSSRPIITEPDSPEEVSGL